jgi:hypothetical protein
VGFGTGAGAAEEAANVEDAADAGAAAEADEALAEEIVAEGSDELGACGSPVPRIGGGVCPVGASGAASVSPEAGTRTVSTRLVAPAFVPTSAPKTKGEMLRNEPEASELMVRIVATQKPMTSERLSRRLRRTR